MTLSDTIDSTQVLKSLADSAPKAYIGGKWVEAEDGSTLVTRDPGTGDAIAEVPAMGTLDVDRAVLAAQEAFDHSGWATLSPQERGVLLHRFADRIEREKSILAQIESLDAGKVLSQAESDVQNLVDTLRYFIEISLHVPNRTPLAVSGYEAATVRTPWGPCGFIIPWNFPLLLIGWNIAPALAAGNTVVIKPAEDTSLSALYLAKLSQEAGIPAGVFNVVTGNGASAGAALAAHPGLKRLAFTGSTEVGRNVAAVCGKNLVPAKLELGGKGAAVVFDDVDIEATAEKLVGAITFHSGQVCCDATRWLVHKPIYDRFVDCCVDRLRQTKIGYQLDEATQMGPVVSSKQKERILGYLQKAVSTGAEAVLKGGEASVDGKNGFYVDPALLAGTLDNVAAQEEIFGPVAFLAPFTDEAQAIAMANETVYGLANSVWTTDLTRAQRVAQQMIAGNSWINAHNLFPHGVPYGGVNASGMGGGVLSVETFLEYQRSCSIVRPL
ncbi:aldehyde dehydrogenase family protein [Bythopirellula goksoeyrii]|uniref:Aldehyde dehydrogenase AldA n=1 Tax=Bythopirellula goksoeyrii TaxID=1400387 RepID=A0A5B9Q7C5_9BACT|nr:aldehyde dehydrogenase family protein [Bythopirellula goksoeyrii]QEG33455.1 Putative aldehyde dehydrogenase AldA [Bythopirellula goksoeyrii]